MLEYWIILYLFLARLFKFWSRTVQIHSIIHCVTAFAWTSCIFFVYLGAEILNTNFIEILSNLNEEQKYMITVAGTHSIGYFIADTIDILVDYNNVKRRVYILHHLAAITGAMLIYLGDYSPIYGIWCLEAGGIVHHLKHAADTNNFGVIPYYLSQIIYHVIYLSSRLLLTFNILNHIIYLYHNNCSPVNILGVGLSVSLLIQNYIWWFQNVRKALNRS